MGSPDEYRDRILGVKVGEQVDQREMLRRLVDLQYARNEVNLVRGTFRARGRRRRPTRLNQEQALLFELFGDTVDRIVPFDVLTGERGRRWRTWRSTPPRTTSRATTSSSVPWAPSRWSCVSVSRSSSGRASCSRPSASGSGPSTTSRCGRDRGVLRASRMDSRHLDGRRPGGDAVPRCSISSPRTISASSTRATWPSPSCTGSTPVTAPARTCWSSTGFRLPSAKDNRPLRFDEFVERVPQCVFVSATPGPFRFEHSRQVVEQVIRPTGLVDPEVTIMPTKGQVDDLLARIGTTVVAGGRVRRRRSPASAGRANRADAFPRSFEKGVFAERRNVLFSQACLSAQLANGPRSCAGLVERRRIEQIRGQPFGATSVLVTHINSKAIPLRECSGPIRKDGRCGQSASLCCLCRTTLLPTFRCRARRS